MATTSAPLRRTAPCHPLLAAMPPLVCLYAVGSLPLALSMCWIACTRCVGAPKYAARAPYTVLADFHADLGCHEVMSVVICWMDVVSRLQYGERVCCFVMELVCLCSCNAIAHTLCDACQQQMACMQCGALGQSTNEHSMRVRGHSTDISTSASPCHVTPVGRS